MASSGHMRNSSQRDQQTVRCAVAVGLLIWRHGLHLD